METQFYNTVGLANVQKTKEFNNPNWKELGFYI